MYCKTCRKNVKSISHWAKVHPQIRKNALNKARRARKGRGKGIGTQRVDRFAKAIREVLRRFGEESD